MTHPRRWIPALLLVAACSSDPAAPGLDATASDAPSTDVPGDLAAAADLTDLDIPTDAPAAVVAGEYPAGPYGSRLGSVLADLTWEGYVNPTGEVISSTLPYTTTSLQALRGSGRGYAMVHVSEFL